MKDLTVKYYTIRRATVCALIDPEALDIVARGVAICSPLDTFDAKKGQKIALNRAISALRLGENTALISPRKFHTIKEGKIVGYGTHLTQVVNEGIHYKVCFLPKELTYEECCILKALKKNALARFDIDDKWASPLYLNSLCTG